MERVAQTSAAVSRRSLNQLVRLVGDTGADATGKLRETGDRIRERSKRKLAIPVGEETLVQFRCTYLSARGLYGAKIVLTEKTILVRVYGGEGLSFPISLVTVTKKTVMRVSPALKISQDPSKRPHTFSFLRENDRNQCFRYIQALANGLYSREEARLSGLFDPAPHDNTVDNLEADREESVLQCHSRRPQNRVLHLIDLLVTTLAIFLVVVAFALLRVVDSCLQEVMAVVRHVRDHDAASVRVAAH